MNLSYNGIKSMPDDFVEYYPVIETLDISFNRLVEFPIQLKTLWRLKNLYIEGNNIQEIPTFVGKLDIQTLGFDYARYVNRKTEIGSSKGSKLIDLKVLREAIKSAKRKDRHCVQLEDYIEHYSRYHNNVDDMCNLGHIIFEAIE